MIEISTDKSKLDIDVIHTFLTNSYWAKGRTIDQVQKSIDNSLCFGVYLDNKQIGFARAVTDYTIYVYLMDIFIVPEVREKGYSKQLMKVILEEPKLQDCKDWTLKTKDAHGLYEQFDFIRAQHPEKIMERIIQELLP
ncbi:MAG: GNAT family N-acetyltransferase [Flavobacteriaceae bacterium]|nr:GNAT family N-acetyltransferase [Flavobacteriaceae bacterium]